MKRVVVIGGGHGLSVILNGLKQMPDLEVSAIVTVADDGGSTGRIRQRYTIPAMGDVRNVMLSLANCNPLLVELMNYRFEGEDNMDIAGHSLGNLILTALTNISGSFSKAIEITSDLLEVKGHIIPSTLQYISLYALMDDDTIVKGEANIPNLLHNIKKVFYHDKVQANPLAIKAINEADLIIYGIGSLYTSILPNTIISGINDALNSCKAKRVYLANCMCQSNETYNYDLNDHVKALLAHKTPVDLVIAHKDIIPEKIVRHYEQASCIEVIDHHDCEVEVKHYDLLKFDDGYAKHDSLKIKKLMEDLL